MGMVGKGSEEELGAFSSFLWGVGLSKIQLIMKASVCFVRCSCKLCVFECIVRKIFYHQRVT